MNDYPDEIREYPRPVVALVGCSSIHAPVTKHLGTRPDINGKEICAFNILSYEESSSIQSARRRKERRLSYDGYTAGGILKTQWLYKHRNLIPSVVVAMFIWEEEKVWKNKENDICVELENIRKTVKNRGTKILLLLVHRQSFVDAQHDERISSLKKRGDLDSRNIVLFDKDNIPESTKKLDKLLLEFSRYYYKEEARRLKKDYVKSSSSITRSSLFMLNVRHHFKVGYFAEFRRDPRATLKYYNLAYGALRDFVQIQVKGNDKYRLFEIKAVAEIINFQICKYYLSLGNLNDGVSQFQKHIKAYRPIIGLAELEFQHLAWLSRQHLVFGQVLEALATQQLPNISKYSNMHPAFYYQAAAKYSIDRKKSAAKLCESMRGSDYFEKFCEQYQNQISSSNMFADLTIASGTSIPLIPLPTAILSLAPSENNQQVTYIGQSARPAELQFFDDNNNNLQSVSVPPSPVLSRTDMSASAISAPGNIPNPLMSPTAPASAPVTPNVSSSSMSSTGSLNSTGLVSPSVSIDYADFIQRSLAAELFTDHSTTIVDLLTKAYEQYKSPKSNRMILHTAALMGQEYFSQQKYMVAKKFFDRICKSYRSEGWWDLLTFILNMSLQCARHLGLVKDYVVYTLELIHTNMTNSPEEKQQLQNNIMKIIHEPSSVASTTAMHLDSPVIIPMCYNHTLIGTKVQFREPSVYAKSNFNFTCKIQAHFPLKVLFSKLRIEFSDPNYDTEITPSSDPTVHAKNEPADENRLLFYPGKAKNFHFTFVSKEKMELQCTKLIMELGTSPSCIRFEWNVTEWPTYRVSEDSNGQLFHERTQTKILAHEAKLLLNVIHHPTALIQEYYHFQLKMRNKGERVLNGTINLELLPATGEGMASPFFTEIAGEPVTSLNLPEISPEAEHIQDLFYRVTLNTVIPSHDIQVGTESKLIPSSISNSIISKKISVKISYMTDAQYIAHTDRTFEVPVQSPFTNQFTLFSSHLQPISTNSGNVLMGQPFFLSADIQCNPTYGLQLIRSSLLLNKGEKKKEVATCVAVSNVTQEEQSLTKEGNYSLWYKLVPNMTGESVELGCLEMEWKRSKHGHLSQVHLGEDMPAPEDSLTSICQFPIPPIKVNSAPFSVKIDVPSFAVVGGVFPVSFLLHNHTDLLQEFALTVTENNCFLFSGPKILNSFCIHPHSNFTLKYSLIPLTAGRQPLPSFQILSKRLNQELIQAKPTRYVFVNPSHWSGSSSHQSKN